MTDHIAEAGKMATGLTHSENVLKNTADVNMPARLGSTICIGRPTIERLALDGAVCFPDGTTLSAADDLYQNNPFDVIAKLMAERDMLLRREAETIARYDAKLDTAERERDEARADRAEGMREGMEDAADRVENFWPRAAEHIRAAMEKE